MTDQFKGHRKTLDSVSDDADVITPSDTENLPRTSRSIYVGTGGDLKVILAGTETPVVFKNTQSGSVLPLRVKRVYLSTTTAVDLVALL